MITSCYLCSACYAMMHATRNHGQFEVRTTELGMPTGGGTPAAAVRKCWEQTYAGILESEEERITSLPSFDDTSQHNKCAQNEAGGQTRKRLFRYQASNCGHQRPSRKWGERYDAFMLSAYCSRRRPKRTTTMGDEVKIERQKTSTPGSKYQTSPPLKDRLSQLHG